MVASLSNNMATEIVLSVMLLLVGIAVLVIIHICIVGRAFRTGYENGGSISVPPPITTSLSVEDLQRIPCFQFDQNRAGDKGGVVDCVVCLESFEEGDKFKVLPICTHRFHSHCIDSWLLKTPICPICRTPIITSPICLQRDENRGVV